MGLREKKQNSKNSTPLGHRSLRSTLSHNILEHNDLFHRINVTRDIVAGAEVDLLESAVIQIFEHDDVAWIDERQVLF